MDVRHVTNRLEVLQQYPLLTILATTTIAIIASVFVLRVSSTRHGDGGTGPPSMPGYWLPFLGHGPQFFLNRDRFLAGLKRRYPEGIFSLTMMGARHHVIYDPSLSNAFMNRQSVSPDEKWLGTRMLTTSFGLPREDLVTYSKLAKEAQELFKHLLLEPGLGTMVKCMIDQVKIHISDFVTFNSSAADQTDWERSANVEIVENSKGETFVEADLMTLTRNFVSRTANQSLFGTDFVENFPEFWDLLWTFDQGSVLLAANMPSWVPWPKIQRAKNARRLMLARTWEFEEAMDKYLDGSDPGIKWQDLGNVSPYVKARVELFRKHSLPLKARASCDLALAWAMNANANQLISWMLFELYRDPVLLEQVREEVAPYVRVVQPQHEFGSAVWVAPELESLDMDGLMNKCPHLKAVYLETVRVYTGIWTIKKLTEEVTLERKRDLSDSYLLHEGDMAHIAHEMHQFDENYFPNPKEWRHDRFLKETVDENVVKTQVVEQNTLRPYGKIPPVSSYQRFIAPLYLGR